MINTSIGLIGVSLQTDRDTPASEPQFVHGLTGGQVFQLDRSIASADVSCGLRAGTDSYVESVVPGLDFDTYGYAGPLPLYFAAAMGTIASTGSDDVHTHVITLGGSIPYLTFWGQIGNEFTRTDGCKVDTLEMEFEGNAPLEFGVTVRGLDAELGLSQFPGSVEPSCFDGYFIPTGGVFKVDTGASTPAVAPITAGSLSLSNSIETLSLAGQVTPGEVAEGKLASSGSVTVRPDDMGLYRKMITGSETGTVPSGSMVYGSFEWSFTHSKNPAHTLVISASKVPFTADFPEVDPSGGAAEIEFSFDDIGIDAADGSPVTVTVTNGVASYI